MIVTAWMTLYAVAPIFAVDPVSQVQLPNCKEVGYLPCFGEQSIMYGMTLVACMFSYFFSRTKLFSRGSIASRYHTAFLVILGLGSVAAIFFRSVCASLKSILLV